MEFVYEEERRECKKISVGEVDSKKIHKGGNGWLVLFIYHPWKKLYVNEKKEKCEKKIQMKKKRMRMKGENEMKRKEGRKGVMWWEKERIGGWSRSEKFVLH